jgi:Fe2+ transport system protein FeoA
MNEQCCHCGCTNAQGSLAELPVGTKATIVGILPQSRGRKKLADVGIVPGTELLIEAHAPFGGLIRVKVMETSMALHKDDAACIMIEKTEDSDNE